MPSCLSATSYSSFVENIHKILSEECTLNPWNLLLFYFFGQFNVFYPKVSLKYSEGQRTNFMLKLNNFLTTSLS